MTPNQSISVQTFVLLVLRASGDLGMSQARLLVELRRESFTDLTAPQLEAAIRELADKSFTTPLVTALGENRWRITSLGRSVLDEQKL